jgi:hypothetical protein
MAAPPYLTLAEAVAAAALPRKLDQPALLRLLDDVAGITPETDPFAVMAAEDALAANARGTAVLEVRPGGWVIDTTSSLARTAVTAALMTAVMYAGGFDQIPAYVLPAILPLLVDMDRVRLSRSDRQLLAVLRFNAGAAAGQPVHPDVLYDRLPDDVRQDVSPLDFADFTERLIAVGEADDPGYGDVTLLDRPRWIRISFT